MKPFILAGLGTLAVTMGMVPFVNNTIILIVLLVLSGIGSGLILPCLNTMITSSVGKEERGIVTSLYNSVRFTGVALGPPVFGAFMNAKTALFLSVASIAAISFFVDLVFIKRPQRIRSKKGHERTFVHKKKLRPRAQNS